MQVETPVAHEVVPTLQGSAGWQALPAAHVAHVPLLQTLSSPQDIPLAIGFPVSTQLTDGAQAVIPAWQGFAGTHVSPGVQATQAPPLQMLPVPHVVPFGALPLSRHTASPVLQTVAPTRQGLPATVHAVPSTHDTQVPAALQT